MQTRIFTKNTTPSHIEHYLIEAYNRIMHTKTALDKHELIRKK